MSQQKRKNIFTDVVSFLRGDIFLLQKYFLEVGFMNKKSYERLTMYVQTLAISDVVRTSAVSGGSTGGGVKEPNDLEWDWD